MPAPRANPRTVTKQQHQPPRTGPWTRHRPRTQGILENAPRPGRQQGSTHSRAPHPGHGATTRRAARAGRAPASFVATSRHQGPLTHLKGRISGKGSTQLGQMAAARNLWRAGGTRDRNFAAGRVLLAVLATGRGRMRRWTRRDS